MNTIHCKLQYAFIVMLLLLSFLTHAFYKMYQINAPKNGYLSYMMFKQVYYFETILSIFIAFLLLYISQKFALKEKLAGATKNLETIDQILKFGVKL